MATANPRFPDAVPEGMTNMADPTAGIPAFQGRDDMVYATPLTGTTVTVPDGYDRNDLIVVPAGTIAALTIKLPNGPRDGAALHCVFTAAVTAITWSNGTMGSDVPTTAAANARFRIVYNAAQNTWY